MTLLFALALAAEIPATTEETTLEAPVEEPVGPDRSQPPPVASPVILELPEPERHVLSDAVEVLLVHVPAVRKVEITAMVRQGNAELTNGSMVEQALGWLADAATADHDASALSAEEDLYDIDVYSTMRTHYGLLGLTVPREELTRGLSLFSEMVRSPAFPKAEAKRLVADKELFYFVRGPSTPDAVASALMAYSWFPPDHPYGERPDLAQLGMVKTKTLTDHYDDWVHNAPITVVVVGDVAWSDVEKPLAATFAGLGKAGVPGADLSVKQPKGTRVLASHLPGQEQVGIQLRMTAPARTAPESVAAWAGQYVFGGHFLSRLNSNLREEKGWTYGSRASYGRSAHQGTLSVSVDVAAENVAGTIREIEAELQRLVDEGVTAAELDLAYRSLASDWNATRMTASEASGRYVGAIEDGETLAERRARYVGLAEVTPEDVKAVASQHWSKEGTRQWVFVGDKALIGPPLEELGFTVEWVDPQPAILGKVPAATP